MVDWIKVKHVWFKGTCTIATDHVPMEVPCWRSCWMPGVAITEEGGGMWVITHEKSGYCICSDAAFFLPHNAIRAAETHLSKYDFTQDHQLFWKSGVYRCLDEASNELAELGEWVEED